MPHDGGPEEAYHMHGRSLLRHAAGETGLVLECTQDGARDDVPVAFWFREEIGPLEARALDLARGRVLDVGAGTGVHTLRLQAQGLQVVALDIAPGAVAVMRARGVLDARLGDVFAFEAGRFDTVLCLCNGLDKVGSMERLPAFLGRLRALLAPDGQALVDSFAPSVGEASEMALTFGLDGTESAPFSVVQVSAEALAEVARSVGLHSSVIARNGGHYLARLTNS